jgi:hypothetical protein
LAVFFFFSFFRIMFFFFIFIDRPVIAFMDRALSSVADKRDAPDIVMGKEDADGFRQPRGTFPNS